uniref:tumor protein p63-regulated gene 1 protein isoform X2 n=1 Tax=Gasterosteus aculeatus aculeatus TaxID=481459 RepID=UPI001A9971A2|nr:tumor protein p63-regulated gene 1 protein isoform X2 [Gasterosteus aculeatus aculeatus]
MAAAEEERTKPGEEEKQPPLGSHTEPPPPTEDPQQPPPTEDPQQPPPTEDLGHTEPPPPTEDLGHTEPPPPTEDLGHTEPPPPTEDPQQPPPTEDTEPPEGPEERAAEVGAARPPRGDSSVEPSLQHFKIRRFFVLRPGTLEQGIKDVKALVEEEVDGSVHSVWLMAEVDHWNNEKERLVLITDNSLLVFKYNFVLFNCEHIHRIPLNIIDRISHGPFSFPKHSLLQRGGEGLRLFWDRQREPSFTSRWNPFAIDFPFITFINHPVMSLSDTFAEMCHIENFQEQIKEAAQKAHVMKPFPGKANGVLVLKQPIHTDAYVGLMSFIGNQNKLGYCMARGNLGF